MSSIDELNSQIKEISFQINGIPMADERRTVLVNKRAELAKERDLLKRQRDAGQLAAEFGTIPVFTNDTRTPAERNAAIAEKEKRQRERFNEQLAGLGSLTKKCER